MIHSTLRRPTVLVVYQDPLLRTGIVAALREHGAFEVFVQGVDAESADAAQIDVIVADYHGGVQLARAGDQVSQPALASARTLVLTPNDREADIRRAIEAGVQGYLLLGGPLGELVDGVTAMANGLRYLCRSVAERMADSLTRTPLTSRETEVLQLVASGESNKGIARRLRIEVGTVKSHMSAIMTKLGASSRTHAAGIASSRGLVQKQAAA
jgi:two-component system NarL family response regulator